MWVDKPLKKSMKKIAASVGLLAVGVSALQAAESSALNSYQDTKPWSIQATLRGFYDDNTSAAADAANRTESSGFSVNPSADYGFVGEQTSLNVGYDFTAQCYDKVARGRVDRTDYTHSFNIDLTHAFSPQHELSASEQFLIGQEPEFLRDLALTTPVDGDNIRNLASVGLDGELTQLLGYSLAYGNSLYDYDDASNSVLYDRMEQSFRIDSRWKLSPPTTAVLGYTYLTTAYDSSQNLPGGAVPADFRDNLVHRLYAGVDQVFTPTLSGSLRGGFEIVDFDNDPTSDSKTSPYIQASLRYQYQTSTSFEVGAQYSRSAASGSQVSGASFIRDMESLSAYASVKQMLAPKLYISGSGQIVRSEYNAPGLAIDGESYVNYRFGVDLSYEINNHFSTQLGYSYDQLTSDPQLRDYDRSRIFAGVTAGF